MILFHHVFMYVYSDAIFRKLSMENMSIVGWEESAFLHRPPQTFVWNYPENELFIFYILVSTLKLHLQKFMINLRKKEKNFHRE